MVWIYLAVYLSIGSFFGAAWFRLLGDDIMGSLRRKQAKLIEKAVENNPIFARSRQIMAEGGADLKKIDEKALYMMFPAIAVGVIGRMILWLPLVLIGNIRIYIGDTGFSIHFKGPED